MSQHIFLACQRGDLDLVQLSIKNKLDADLTHPLRRESLLFIAAENGHQKLCRYLLDIGADCELANKDGWTPLHAASYEGHEGICKMLIDARANVNQTTTNDGKTPLFIASREGHKEICWLLISAGANVDQATTDQGVTPLLIASDFGHKEICQLLISAGANVDNARNNDKKPEALKTLSGLSTEKTYIQHINPFNASQLLPPPMTLEKQRPKEEQQYIDLIREILENGEQKDDRTGTGTYSIFAKTLRFDLTGGKIPLLTTKKVFWKAIVEELIFFIKGHTNTKELSEKGVKIWEGNSSREYLDSIGLTSRKEGDIGPCFPAGTPVLTYDGYKMIEDVSRDDLLFTHTGQFKEIEEIHIREYHGKLVEIKAKYHPFSISSTPEHPYLVRKFSIKDRYQGKRNVVIPSDPEWIEAKDITKKNCLLGFKIESSEELPTFQMEKYVNQHSERVHYEKVVDKAEEWFMMGYYLGNGWMVDEKFDDKVYKRIYFAFPSHKNEELKKRIGSILNIQLKCVNSAYSDFPTCFTYRCFAIEWSTILSTFGKYAHGKKVPNWVHRAPKEMIDHFINGYAEADGCHRQTKTNTSRRFTTVSLDIAHSIQRLLLKLGSFSSISFQKRGYKKEIMGKMCNQRDCYFMEVYEQKRRSNYSFIEDGYAWFVVGSINETEDQKTVYNFTVKDDNTYTVSNLTVHNCYGFQWRHFGAEYKGCDEDYSGKGIDQLQNVIKTIKEEPTSRRMVVTAWNPAQLGEMALPPCHMTFQFYVFKDGSLGCTLYQRSCDVGLGLPFNIASYSLLTHLIAQICGKKAAQFAIFITDAHIYLNHVEALKVQCERPILNDFPCVRFTEEIKELDEIDSKKIELVGYFPQSAIKMEMSK